MTQVEDQIKAAMRKFLADNGRAVLAGRDKCQCGL